MADVKNLLLFSRDAFKLEIQAFQAKLEHKIKLFQVPRVPTPFGAYVKLDFELEKLEFELELMSTLTTTKPCNSCFYVGMCSSSNSSFLGSKKEH